MPTINNVSNQNFFDRLAIYARTNDKKAIENLQTIYGDKISILFNVIDPSPFIELIINKEIAALTVLLELYQHDKPFIVSQILESQFYSMIPTLLSMDLNFKILIDLLVNLKPPVNENDLINFLMYINSDKNFNYAELTFKENHRDIQSLIDLAKTYQQIMKAYDYNNNQIELFLQQLNAINNTITQIENQNIDEVSSHLQEIESKWPEFLLSPLASKMFFWPAIECPSQFILEKILFITKIDLLEKYNSEDSYFCTVIKRGNIELFKKMLVLDANILRRLTSQEGRIASDYAELHLGTHHPLCEFISELEVNALDIEKQDNTAVINRQTEPLQREINTDKTKSLSPSFLSIINSYTIDAKYLGHEKLSLPGETQANKTATIEFNDYHKYIFSLLSKTRTKNQFYFTHVIDTTHLLAIRFSLDPDHNLSSTQRVTFVYAGRKEQAHVPTEMENGRVIIVFSKNTVENPEEFVAPFQDVLIIERLELVTFTNPALSLTETEMGYITSRRLTSVLVAKKYALTSFIALDDNLEKLFLNKQISASDPTWKDYYAHLSQEAFRQEIICLSIRNHRPTLQKKKSTINVGVDTKIGSKIFYIDSEKLFTFYDSDQKLMRLFPPVVNLWGEDLFMQFMLISQKFQVSVLPHSHSFMIRAQKIKDACLKNNLLKAHHWITMPTTELFPGHQRIIHHVIKELIVRSDENYNQTLEKFKIMDLGQIHSASNQPLPALTDIEGFIFPPEFNTLKTMLSYLLQIHSPIANLAPRQLQALESIAEMEHNTGLIDMATGTGKTLIFSTIAALLLRNQVTQKKNIVIIEPQQQMVTQVYHSILDTFNKLMPELQIAPDKLIKISSSVKDIPLKILTYNNKVIEGGYIFIFCAKSFNQLLKNASELMNLIGTFIIDEIHHHSLKSDTCAAIRAHCENQNDVYGLAYSATPGSKGKRFGKTLFSYSISNAITDKVVSPWFIQSFSMNYEKRSLAKLINVLSIFLKHRKHPSGKAYADLKGIIFLPALHHANKLKSLLDQENIRTEVVTSYNKAGVNQEILSQLSDINSPLKIVIAIKMLQVGADYDVDYVIPLQRFNREKDLDNLQQVIGRVIRYPASSQREKQASILVFQDAQIDLPPISHREDPVYSPEFLAQPSRFQYENIVFTIQTYKKPIEPTHTERRVNRPPAPLPNASDLIALGTFRPQSESNHNSNRSLSQFNFSQRN